MVIRGRVCLTCGFCVLAATITLALFAAALNAADAEKDVATASTPLGKQIDDFQLPDCLGATRALKDWTDKKAVVIVFTGTECPLAKLYALRLGELAERYKDKSVQFVAIDSNQQDSLAEIARFGRDHKIEFPLLKDLQAKVADQFGATRTPEVFVLDADRKVRYWGAIDDQYNVGVTRPKVEKEYLAAALDELLAGKEVTHPAQRPVGCYISRANRKGPSGDITYSSHIARIINKHCVECHRPGQAAPFALTSFNDVASWVDTIREVIHEQRMPPWHANPHYGKFRNDARLSDAEKDMVFKWIDNGAPQGNPDDLPEPPKFAEGWRLPKPDLVVRMPEPYKVPARGVEPYRYFTVDPQFKEDVWVRGAEGRPGSRAVVHHMIVFYIAPGQERNPQDVLNNAVASYVPGMPVILETDGYAGRIPAGSKLIFQMHYTPNGVEQTDQSEAAFVFADPKKVQKELVQGSALNWRFQIPPGDPDYPAEARYRFHHDVDLYSLIPHMHLRGKAFRFTAIYPDGNREVLLDVPHYDFKWQNVYYLAEPKRMVDGAQILCEARFDNSANNPMNPDPTKTVRWGDQTWDEMMMGSFSMSVADQDLTLGPPKVQPAADGKYEVYFRYRPREAAEAVFLAGEFNDWKPDGHKMDGPDGDGFYNTTITLAAGRYEYKFVVNGKHWKPDPGNWVQAGDYRNSVVLVGKEK